MKMKQIKKELMTNQIIISLHAQERLKTRGYQKKDIIQCIMTGSITEKQFKNNRFQFLIEGNDIDGLPIIVVVGKHSRLKNLVIVTIMPPISMKFKRVI